MMHPMLYGARYGIFMLLDLSCFAWHGHRPLWWMRELVKHRFAAPKRGVGVPTEQDVRALMKAKLKYPERTCYLSLSSETSPWYGTRVYNEVKVLVADHTGAKPSESWNGYGMGLGRFEAIMGNKGCATPS